MTASDHLLDRTGHRDHVLSLLAQFPVVAIIGPRQVGKTTLARLVAGHVDGPVHHARRTEPMPDSSTAQLADR